MIVKSFEIKKKKFESNDLFLIYGQNGGLKKEIIKDIFGKFEVI